MSLGHWLYFPIFILQLLVQVGRSLSHLIWKNSRRPLVLVSAFLFFVLVLIWKSGSLLQLAFSTTSPTRLSEPIKTAPQASSLQQQLSSMEKMYQLQPTHRDVLLNLARIQDALGQASAAAQFREAARQVDPNSPLVQ